MKIKVSGFYTSKYSVEFEDVTKQIYVQKQKVLKSYSFVNFINTNFKKNVHHNNGNLTHI